MKPILIIAIVIPIIITTVFLVQSIPQQNLENISEEQSDEVAWQLLQKTYLEQECREQYMGQPGQLDDCYNQIDEEQRLNPPINPQQ